MTRKWLSNVAAVAATLTSLIAISPTFAQTKPMASPTPAMAKKMPMRDAKGRFVKATPSPKPMMGMKKMPMRDAKGRFMKASPSPKPMPMMGGKKMPMRDSKGRFMKASPTPKPMMAKP